MFDDSNEILKQGLPLFVGNNSSCQVTEDVRATCLNGIEVA